MNYTHDHIGNRQTYGLDANPDTAYTANDLNQYTATTYPTEAFTHDFDGNLTQDAGFNYTWDAENRLKTATPRNPTNGAKKVAFVYDYMGRRVRKTVYTYNSGWPADDSPNERQHFVYDGWNVVMVLDGLNSNAITRKYTWGLDLSGTIHGAGGIGGLLAAFVPGAEPDDARLWYFYDGNGNVGQVLDATSLQSIGVTAKYEYDPYGNVIASSGAYANTNPFRFSTKWYDVETDMYYYGYRYYLPRYGRWGSRDPIGEWGGLNLYLSLANNPVSVADLLGLADCEIPPWLPGSNPLPRPPNPPPGAAATAGSTKGTQLFSKGGIRLL